MMLFVALLLGGSAPPADHAPAIAAAIDRHLGRAIASARVEAAPRADDVEFLRRAHLDLAGRIPTVSQARAFLGDTTPRKRARLVEELAASHGFANQMAQVLRAAWVPQASTNLRTQFLGVSMEAWIARRLRKSARYDALVRELLSSPLEYLVRKGDGPSPSLSTDSPTAFWQAADLKAETATGNVGRLFLGVRLECAQCHDHPFAKWTKKQFWETAAFFAAVAPPDAGARLDPFRRVIQDPLSKTEYRPHFLEGTAPEWKANRLPRRVFADWLTKEDNPFFARVAVNRMWAHFFGAGLVDPVDDFGGHNEPAHPELLDELARLFAAARYDLRVLSRGIGLSKAYGRTSRLTHPGQKDPRLFARMAVKGLSAEQLIDSLALATGYREETPRAARAAFGYEPGSPRAAFMALFGGGSARSDMQTSILQALGLMNGPWMTRQTDPERGETLRAILDGPFKDDTARLEALHLAALSRRPSLAETWAMMACIKRSTDRRRGFADVFWVLLNSNEFLLNR